MMLRHDYMEDYKNIRFYQNSGKLTRMRKQCAPGLLSPSPQRPGYEAMYTAK